MSQLSNYLEKKLLDHITGFAAYTAPTDIYVALFTAAPNDAGGGTEATGTGYAREVVTFDEAVSPDGQADSDAVVEFVAGADWGTIVAVGLFDAATDGNLLFYGSISPTRTVNNGDTLRFPVGDIALILA